MNDDVVVDTVNGKFNLRKNKIYSIKMMDKKNKYCYLGYPIVSKNDGLIFTFKIFGFIKDGGKFVELSEDFYILEKHEVAIIGQVTELNMAPGNFQFIKDGKMYYGY